MRNETSQIPVTGPGTCLALVSIRPGQGTRPDESKASDSHARSSQIPAKFRLFFWQRRILDNVDFGQRGRTLSLSTARNLDFGQRGFCHGVDFFSRNEWQWLFGKWGTVPDHYSVFLLFHFPFEQTHQIEITVNPENEANLRRPRPQLGGLAVACSLLADPGRRPCAIFFDVTLVCDSSPVA